MANQKNGAGQTSAPQGAVTSFFQESQETRMRIPTRRHILHAAGGIAVSQERWNRWMLRR